MFGFIKHRTIDNDIVKVQEYIGNLSWVNAGGCGIAALAMYRWLKKHKKLTKTTSFIFLDNSKWMHDNNKKVLKTNNGTPCSCSHVVLMHGKTFMDSQGVYDIKKFVFKLRVLSEDFVVKSINNIDSWNDSFDRKKQVPKISRRLGIDLSDIILSSNL